MGKQTEEPFANTKNPDGGTEPVVRQEPDTTFDERTRVHRAYEVGDDTPRDPYAKERPVVDPIETKGGVQDRSIGTPVGVAEAENSEGHETPARNDGVVSTHDGRRIDVREEGETMTVEEAQQEGLKAEDSGRTETEVEKDTEALKDEESRPATSVEAQNTEEAEQQKGVSSNAEALSQADSKTSRKSSGKK